MMPPRVIRDSNEAVEDRFYILGDARDFADREEVHLCDVIDDVAFGSLSSSEARLIVRDVFAKARRDFDEWEAIFTGHALRLEMPYLHPSLKVGRVVAVLPDGAA